MRGTAAAAGIAFVNSFGNIGGAVGPSVFGVLQNVTGSMNGGMLGLAVLTACAAAMCVALRWHDAVALVARPRPAR